MPEGRWIKGTNSAACWKEYTELCNDMELNRWTECRIFCVLLGTARDWDDIRRIGKAWLDKGKDCIKPESIAELK